MTSLAVAALVIAVGTSTSTSAPAPTAFRVEVSGTGRPMILIPGLASAGAVWQTTVAHFATRYTCHVLTLAGFAGVPATGEHPRTGGATGNHHGDRASPAADRRAERRTQ